MGKTPAQRARPQAIHGEVATISGAQVRNFRVVSISASRAICSDGVKTVRVYFRYAVLGGTREPPSEGWRNKPVGIELVAEYAFGMRAVPHGHTDSGLWFTTIDGRIVQFDPDLRVIRELRHPQPGWLGAVSFHGPTNRIAIACRDRVILRSVDGTTLWEAAHTAYPDDGYSAATCLIDRHGRIWTTSAGDRSDVVVVLDGETGLPAGSIDLGVPGYITTIRNQPIGADVLIGVFLGQDGQWSISASVVDGQVIANRHDGDVPGDWSPAGDLAVWYSHDSQYLTVAHSPAGPVIASRHICEVSDQYGFANPLFVGDGMILADDEETAYLFSSGDLSIVDRSRYGGDIESLETVACLAERRWLTYNHHTKTAAIWEWKDAPERPDATRQ